MTDFNGLKQEIEQYVRTGMTEAKRRQLVSQAGKIGISPGQLVMLIKNAELELKFATGISNTEYPISQNSGFLTADDDDEVSSSQSNDSELASGFVVDESCDETVAKPSEESERTADSTIAVVSENDFTEVRKLDVEGAMSEVYSAIHLGRRRVIIKRIKPEFRNNKDYVDLFYKEFDVGYSLQNSNIVQFYGKGEDSNGPFYYMEYVDGRTLRDYINDGNPKNNPAITKILLQLLDALKYMHQKQIFHRDLKPDNIMITYKGDNVKIIDFGIAAADFVVDRLKRAGTPKYAAPELMNNAIAADQRSDIYSVGIIIIEMFSGAADRKHLSSMEQGVFRTIADKATMALLEDRFQSCDEIIKLLKSNDGTSNPIPKWLEDRIKEYAYDGVITRNERAVLDREIEKAGVDKQLAEALISDEIEKAIQRRQQEDSAKKKLNSFADKKSTSTKQKSQMKVLFEMLLGIAAVLLVVFLVINLLNGKLKMPFGDSQTEYVQDDGFKKGDVLYTTKSVDLRKLASAEGKTIRIIPKETPVEVLDVLYSWVEVKVDNKRGYIDKKYLKHK